MTNNEGSEKEPKDITPKYSVRPAWQELEGAEEATRELHRPFVERQLQREKFKQQRILASDIDEYTHALETIIKWAEHYGNGKDFSLDYYYFNFEDRMDDSKMLERFLDKLKDAGCFSSWSRTNYTGGTRFSFIEVSLNKLKSYAAATHKQKDRDKTPDIYPIGSSSGKHIKIKSHGLSYNNATNQLSYKNKKATHAPKSREIRFFTALYHVAPNTHSHKNIARDSELEYYKERVNEEGSTHETLENKDFARDSHDLRRDFRKAALSLGMPKDKFASMIKSVRGVGYRLNRD